jgi:hypothetical protein
MSRLQSSGTRSHVVLKIDTKISKKPPEGESRRILLHVFINVSNYTALPPRKS